MKEQDVKYESPSMEIYEIILEDGISLSVFGEAGAAGKVLEYRSHEEEW